MKNILYILAILVSFNTFTNANNNAVSEMPPPPPVLLTSGTLILLETNELIWSDQVTVGKVFNFRVLTNVMAEGEVAISTGALAVGRVKHIQMNTYNEPEEIRIEMLYVQAVDGQMVPLNGNEQSIRGQFPNEPTSVQFGTSITSHVTNNIMIETN